MILSTALCASVGALAVGTAALWSHFRRPQNQVLAAGSVFVCLWMLCWHGDFSVSATALWLRGAWFVAGFLPVFLVFLRETILWPQRSLRERFFAIRVWWLFPSVWCSWVVWRFFHHEPLPLIHPVFGTMMVAPIVAGLLSTAMFALGTIQRLQGRIGVHRLDLQLLGLGGSLLILVTFVFPVIGVVSRDPMWDRLMPLLILAIFAGLAWTLLTTRLLDAKHLLTLGIEKIALVATASVFIWGIRDIAAQFMPAWLAFGVALALGLWFVAELRPWLQELTQRKATAERLRRSAFEIARRDLRPEQMEEAFLKLLTQWGHCDRAVILMATQGRLTGGGLEWPLHSDEMKLLHRMRWATAERLDREKPRFEGPGLAALMKVNGFGILVASSGPTLGFVIGLSFPRSRMPFTYPQVTQLLALADTIESALSRAHYLMKVQHAEQLATVGLLGASIAHEIRNPLVSIKTFVQLLPQHYQEAAFREKFFRLIGDEVGRIDRMTEQLLDLSTPRVFTTQETAIHLLLTACVDLISAKADDKRVKIVTDYQADNDVVFTDPNAVKQVVLNLGFNAIQALEQKAGDREVQIATRKNETSLEIVVSDNGAGIAPEVWSRLFQPFQSTKSSGFGLGLATCRDILTNLHASITADQPSAGRGATFRILLPCQPPTF